MITDNNNHSDIKQADKKPASADDRGNIQIDCYVRISDPNTQETLVEVRE